MSSNGTVRRTARRIPNLRSLPVSELDKITRGAIVRDYHQGQVIWRTEKRLNFWAVIETGEIAVERRYRGRTIHLTRLSAGDRVDPDRWNPCSNQMSIAQALTDVRLHIIWHRPQESTSSRMMRARLQSAWLMKYVWIGLSIVMILSLGMADIRRILSDTVVLAAVRQSGLSAKSGEITRLLSYASVLDPGTSFPYNQQGVLKYREGDLQRATEIFTVGLQMDPAFGATLNNLAVAHFVQGDIQQAIQLQQQAVLNDPDNARVQYNLGLLWRTLDRDRESLRAFKEAGILQPHWALPALQQALVYLKMREYNQAEVAAARAVQLDPSQAVGHSALAIALYEQKRDLEALAAVETALALTAEDTVPGFYKALILERQGKRDDAVFLLFHLLENAKDPLKKDRITEEIRYLDSQP